MAKQVGNHPEYANSIHLVQDKLSLDRKGKSKASMKDTKQKLTGIKEMDDLEVDDGSRRYEAFLHMLCILDGFLDVSFKSVKLVKFLVNLVSSHGRVEKVKALGANGEVSGSRVRVVRMVVDGKKVRARLVSNVVAKVEELALDAMEYDDQDK
nr:hypothetical protein [Tanacetum cinerariifolium]